MNAMKEDKEKRVIWKWPLRLDSGKPQAIRVPVATEFLSAQLQGSQVCIWGLVNPNQIHKEMRFFEIIGTGQPLPAELSRVHFSTIVFGPELVLHVFELLTKPDISEVVL
jgi:hypothetical protein